MINQVAEAARRVPAGAGAEEALRGIAAFLAFLARKRALPAPSTWTCPPRGPGRSSGSRPGRAGPEGLTGEGLSASQYPYAPAPVHGCPVSSAAPSGSVRRGPAEAFTGPAAGMSTLLEDRGRHDR